MLLPVCAAHCHLTLIRPWELLLFGSVAEPLSEGSFAPVTAGRREAHLCSWQNIVSIMLLMCCVIAGSRAGSCGQEERLSLKGQGFRNISLSHIKLEKSVKHKCPDLHAEQCINSSAGLASGVSLNVFKLSFVPRSLFCLEIHLCFPATQRGEVCCCSDISQLLCTASELGTEICAQPQLSSKEHGTCSELVS